MLKDQTPHYCSCLSTQLLAFRSRNETSFPRHKTSESLPQVTKDDKGSVHAFSLTPGGPLCLHMTVRAGERWASMPQGSCAQKGTFKHTYCPCGFVNKIFQLLMNLCVPRFIFKCSTQIVSLFAFLFAHGCYFLLNSSSKWQSYSKHLAVYCYLLCIERHKGS